MLPHVLPPTHRLRRALRTIYGIGGFLADQICDQLGFPSGLTVGELSLEQKDRLGRILQYYYVTEAELRKQTADAWTRCIQIGCYRGIRVTQRLPLRGQRTHTNARTARKLVRRE